MCSLRPLAQIHLPWLYPLTSLRSFFHSQRLEAWRSAAHQLHFSVSYRPVIYRARTNIQWKEGSGSGWRQVKPRNICPFKDISFLGMLRIHCRGVSASLVVTELACLSKQSWRRGGRGGEEEPHPSPISHITERSTSKVTRLKAGVSVSSPLRDRKRKEQHFWDKKRNNG